MGSYPLCCQGSPTRFLFEQASEVGSSSAVTSWFTKTRYRLDHQPYPVEWEMRHDNSIFSENRDQRLYLDWKDVSKMRLVQFAYSLAMTFLSIKLLIKRLEISLLDIHLKLPCTFKNYSDSNHSSSAIWNSSICDTSLGFPSGSDGKESACNAGDLGSTLGWEDPLKKGTATHSRILAWKIPSTKEPGGLQSMELQRVRHY